MVTSRGGSFTPSPAQQQQQQQQPSPLQPQSIATAGVTHSPHGSHHGPFSAGASPSTNSPTGANQVTKIVVAQVSLLLGSLKEDKDRNPKWEQQAEQLRKVGLLALASDGIGIATDPRLAADR
jgi:CCR4-NOT transcription complex subunit 1